MTDKVVDCSRSAGKRCMPPNFLKRRSSGCPVERLPSFLHAVPASDTVPIRWSDGYNDDTSLTVLGARPTKVDAGSAWDEEKGLFFSCYLPVGKGSAAFPSTARQWTRVRYRCQTGSGRPVSWAPTPATYPVPGAERSDREGAETNSTAGRK